MIVSDADIPSCKQADFNGTFRKDTRENTRGAFTAIKKMIHKKAGS